MTAPLGGPHHLGLGHRLVRHALTGAARTQATARAGVPTRHERIEFTCGFCLELAIVLAQHTRWPIRAEIVHADTPYAMLHHAWVINAAGRAVDINGIHATDYATTYPVSPSTLVTLDLADAQTRWPPNRSGITWATEIARRCQAHFGISAETNPFPPLVKREHIIVPIRPVAYRNTLTGIVWCATCVEDFAYFFDEQGRFQIVARENVYADGSESIVTIRRVADGMEASCSVGTSYPEDYAEGIVEAREFYIPLYRPREDACAQCHRSLRSKRHKAHAA